MDAFADDLVEPMQALQLRNRHPACLGCRFDFHHLPIFLGFGDELIPSILAWPSLNMIDESGKFL
jgi:hypothetical protein